MTGRRLLLALVLWALLPIAAATAITDVDPAAVTIAAGDAGTVVVSTDNTTGSCLTADAGDPDVTVEIDPQCNTAAGPKRFVLTIFVADDADPGSYTVRVQEFDAGLDNLLDSATIALTVGGGAASTTTSAPTTSTAAPTTSTTTTSTTTTSTTTPVPPSTTTSPPTTTTTTEPATLVPTTLTPTTLAPDDGEGPLALWPWLLGAAVALAGGLAMWAARDGRSSGDIAYVDVSAGRSFAKLAELLQQNRDAVASRLAEIASSDDRVTVAFARLAGPGSPLRFTLARGKRSRPSVAVLVSAEGLERRIVAESGEVVSTVQVGAADLRDALGFLVDDIRANGDVESAAAINRWLG